MQMEPSWYALQVKPNTEVAVSDQLRHKGVEEFLPLQCSRRQWSDRTKAIFRPLFPGYIFCRLVIESGPAASPKVVTTPGVLRFVGFGGGPERIPDSQIEAVERMVDSRRRLRTLALVREGQKVRVASGPLAGMNGILLKIKNDRHLVVNLPLFERAVAVTVEEDMVEPYA